MVSPSFCGISHFSHEVIHETIISQAHTDIAFMELDDHIDDDTIAVQYESPLSLRDDSKTPNRLIKKSSFRTRWLVLVFCCILMSSNYYA